MEGYSEKVMEHFRNPRNVGEIKDPDGVGHVGNAVCGDIMELYIKVKDNIIVDAKFKTFGCIPPNGEIVKPDGSWAEIISISKGDNVINSNGESTEVIQTYLAKYEGDILEITPFVSTFNSFEVTSNHPVLCIKRSWFPSARRTSSKCNWLHINHSDLLNVAPDFVQAGELEPSDYLVYVSKQKIEDNTFYTKEIMRLIGYYLSEGYITAQGSVVAFAFNKNEKKTIEEIKYLLEKVTGKTAKSRIRKNVIEIYICSRKWAKILYLAAGRLARKKKLSEEILLLPFEKLWEMMDTYIIGDGNLYRRRPQDSKTYRIKTASRGLAIQIQMILSRARIFPSVKKISRPLNHTIEGRKVNQSEIYEISFKTVKKHNFTHSNGSFILIPIRKIEKKPYKGMVYNFQVAWEPNTYLIKGFAVHNCGAAIATSSMVTELVKGKSVDEALRISNRAVAEALGGLPPVKMHCSVLAEDALKSAIEDYLKKKKGTTS